jgi:hypothetical protein
MKRATAVEIYEQAYSLLRQLAAGSREISAVRQQSIFAGCLVSMLHQRGVPDADIAAAMRWDVLHVSCARLYFAAVRMRLPDVDGFLGGFEAVLPEWQVERAAVL